MKLTPKQAKRYEPIIETDEHGKTWLTGYRRKAGSRKGNREPLKLKERALVEVREGRVFHVEKEEAIEELLFVCPCCWYQAFGQTRSLAQMAHDKYCDSKAILCEHLVRPVLEGETLPEHDRKRLPLLAAGSSNQRTPEEYLRMKDEDEEPVLEPMEPHNEGSFHGFIGSDRVYDDCCPIGHCMKWRTCPHGVPQREAAQALVLCGEWIEEDNGKFTSRRTGASMDVLTAYNIQKAREA